MVRRVLHGVLAIMALLTGIVLVAPGAASAAPTPYRIRLAGYNWCLDADSTTLPANGTKIQLWDCGTNPVNRRWILVNNDRIQNQAAAETYAFNGYLDADITHGGGNGAKAQLWVYRDSALNQKWSWSLTSSPTTIKSKFNGLCLDADTSSALRNGTKVHMWTCAGETGSGSYNQRWVLERV